MRSARQRTADAIAPLQATPGRTQHVVEQVPARRGVRVRLAVDPIGELRATRPAPRAAYPPISSALLSSHESPFGTKRTCRSRRSMSAFGGKADMSTVELRHG